MDVVTSGWKSGGREVVGSRGDVLGWGLELAGSSQGHPGSSRGGSSSEREVWVGNGTGFDRELLLSLLKRDALQVGKFVLASGRESHYYVDARKVTLGAEGASVIGAGVLDRLGAHPEVAAVGGMTLGADPIVGATLGLAPRWGRPALRGFLVRKESKGYGTGKLVEGPVEPGMVVAVVEDVATTGGSALRAVEAVEAMGCRVALVIAVLDRLEGAAAAFASRGLAFTSLVTIRDLGVEPLAVVG
jgi:orotate phosphoribosyltransferase